MAQDITSYSYPSMSEFLDAQNAEENHSEPASEQYRSAVEGDGHPFFSPEGLKRTLNLSRALSNSETEFLTGEIDPKLIASTMATALKTKVPYELLIFAMDFEKKLDTISGEGSANFIANKMKGFISELSSSLGRQPHSSELLMAFAFDSAGKVSSLLEAARNNPYERASPGGSPYDDRIFNKPGTDSSKPRSKPRSNKEVIQFFANRMGLGSRVFPYTVD